MVHAKHPLIYSFKLTLKRVADHASGSDALRATTLIQLFLQGLPPA